MAFVITIAQRKGGAGKTTLACQLAAACAVAGRNVCGVDLDEQGSFLEWGERRAQRKNALPIGVLRVGLFGLSTTMWRLQQTADVIIIDTPPNVGADVRQAVRVSDLVLTPLQLSPLDLSATMPTAKLIGEEGGTPLFVVNRTPPRARIADAIRDEIQKSGLPLAKTELGNRTAFSESLASGRGVAETAPKSAAGKEVRAIADEIAESMKSAEAA